MLCQVIRPGHDYGQAEVAKQTARSFRADLGERAPRASNVFP